MALFPFHTRIPFTNTFSIPVARTCGFANVERSIAWLAGALLATLDGFVWSELGAAMPKAGGTYVFLREAYGPARWGRLMSFLFVWQTFVQAPLSVASASIGFARYAGYIHPLTTLQAKAISGSLVIDPGVEHSANCGKGKVTTLYAVHGLRARSVGRRHGDICSWKRHGESEQPVHWPIRASVSGRLWQSAPYIGGLASRGVFPKHR